MKQSKVKASLIDCGRHRTSTFGHATYYRTNIPERRQNLRILIYYKQFKKLNIEYFLLLKNRSRRIPRTIFISLIDFELSPSASQTFLEQNKIQDRGFLTEIDLIY